MQTFLASPAYRHFLSTFQSAQNETTLVVTTVKPADLSQFLLREQGFGQLTEILKIKSWFTDTLSEFEAAASFKEKQHQNQNS